MKGKNNLLNEDEERCYQHFWRSFKPRDRREVDKLCAKLGRKIFAIEESTGTLHYSKNLSIQAIDMFSHKICYIF